MQNKPITVLVRRDVAILQSAEIKWMYICQKCLFVCIFDSKREFAVINLMAVFLTIFDVYLPVSGCKNASVGCIYGSNYWQRFIQFDIFEE